MGLVDDNALQRLVYRSVSLLDPDDRDGFSEIVRVSDSNNFRAGITGCLTLTEGRFVQVLEGSSEKIHGLMGRMLNDRRHSCLDVLAQRPITGRLFRSWGMVRIIVPPHSPELLRIVAETGGAAHVTSILLGLLQSTSVCRDVQSV